MFETLPMRSERTQGALTAEVAELEAMPVGSELADRLTALPSAGSPSWSDSHLRLRVVGRWTAVATWAEGQALAHIAAGAADVGGAESAIDAVNYATDLALQTQVGERSADRRIELATELATRLPGMAAAVGVADLTLSHARALSRVLGSTGDDIARRVDARIVPRAIQRRWTPGELAAAARRLLLQRDPDGGAVRHD